MHLIHTTIQKKNQTQFLFYFTVLIKFIISLMTTLKIFLHLALFLAISYSSLAQSPPSDSDNKCGGCPCSNPCTPPPPPPSPPPKKSPPTNYCPPPPSSGGGGGGQFPPSPPYMFINGPPQDLYPIATNFSGSGRSFSTGPVSFLISWVVGMIVALIMW